MNQLRYTLTIRFNQVNSKPMVELFPTKLEAKYYADALVDDTVRSCMLKDNVNGREYQYDSIAAEFI